MFIRRGPTVLEPELTDQDLLGMFEDTEYTEEHVTLRPGDRLLLPTDGVHVTPSPNHEKYADTALLDLLEETRDQPITTVMRAIIDGLHHHQQATELDDDAVILIIDWTGPQDASPPQPATDDTQVAMRAARRLKLIKN